MVTSTSDYFGLGMSTGTTAYSTYSSGYNSYGSESATKYKVDNIMTQLEAGHEDQVMEQFESLVDSMRSQQIYAGYDEDTLRAMARDKFIQYAGVDLIDAIESSASEDFSTGLKDAMNPFESDSMSKSDLISEITGTRKESGDTAAKITGKVAGIAGSAAAGAGIGAALGLCGGPLAPLTSTAGAIIGGLIGGGAAILNTIF